MIDDSDLPPPIAEVRDYCFWKRCKNESEIILLGYGVCQIHYEKYLSLYTSASSVTIKKHMNAKITKLIKDFYKEK
jgi:hypothetical protein